MGITDHFALLWHIKQLSAPLDEYSSAARLRGHINKKVNIRTILGKAFRHMFISFPFQKITA